MRGAAGRMIRRSAVALLGAALAAASGCAGGSATVSHGAAVRVSGRLLVVPLKDKERYYYDSEDGMAIANAALLAASSNSKRITPLDYNKVRGLVRGTILDKTISNDQWAIITKAAKADYAVYGSVDDLRWQDPNDPGMPRCTFAVTFHVYSRAKGREVYAATVAGTYPVMPGGDMGVTVYEMGREKLQDLSRVYIGTVVARTFYHYELNRIEDRSVRINRLNITP